MNRMGLLIIETISLLDTRAGRLFELILVEQGRIDGSRPPNEMTSPYSGITPSECKRTKLSDLLRVNKGSLSLFMGSIRPAKTNATL